MSQSVLDKPTEVVILNPQCRHFLKFCKTYLTYVEGTVAGQPLVFEPWMIVHVINPLFERGVDGRRRYTTAYIQLAKGNMKSTFGAALAIYLTVVEGAKMKGYQCAAIAASRDQAKVVFNNAKAMVEASPLLLDWITPGRDVLYVRSTRARFYVLSSDAPKTHGKRPVTVICDELHAHENGELYEAMQSAMITADEGLLITLTNAGADELHSKCGEVYRLGKSGDDPTMYFYAPEVTDKQVNDPEKWKRANPASFITIEKLLAQQKRMPPFVFERWHLNRWTRGLKEWLPKGAWDAIEGDATLIPGETVVLGLDMSKRHDSTALVIIAPRDGKFVAVCETWAVWNDPSKPPPDVDHIIEDEDHIPMHMVIDRVRELCREYNVVEIPYDPWRITDTDAENYMAEGLPMVRFDQNLTRMAPASQGLFQAVIEKLLVHGGDPKFTAQIKASVAKDYGERGWKLDKDKASNFMDAAVALAMAVDRGREYVGWASKDAFTIRYF